MAGSPQARPIRYVCSECGKEFPRDALTVKRVTFSMIGPSGKTLKSRTVGWLCPTHLAADPAWDVNAYSTSNGIVDEQKEGHAQA